MYKSITLLLFALIAFSVYGQNTAQQVRMYRTFDQFDAEFEMDENVIYVFNYWATWCKPCIKELPYFEAITEKYPNDQVQVVLVSIDFEDKVVEKLLPFVQQQNLQSTVVSLTDDRYNDWIDRVDERWSGAIPATVVHYNGQKLFHEGEFRSTAELETFFNQIKNRP